MPDEPEDQPINRISKQCHAAGAMWETPEKQAVVKESCEVTRAYMQKNKGSFGSDGVEQKEPWFPKLEPAKTDRQLHSRKIAMNGRVFENGLRHLINELILGEHIDERHWGNLEDAITYKTMAFHHELVLINDAFPGERKPVTLASLAKRFNYKSGGWRVRNKLFPIMSELGLWSITWNGDEWGITLGRVADIFHDEVFYKITTEFEGRLKGEA